MVSNLWCLGSIIHNMKCIHPNTTHSNYFSDKEELVLWGFNPQTGCIASIPTAFTRFGDRAPVRVYGNGSSIVGVLDKEGQIWQCSLIETESNPVLLLNRCVDVAYCGIDNTIVAIRGKSSFIHGLSPISAVFLLIVTVCFPPSLTR